MKRQEFNRISLTIAGTVFLLLLSSFPSLSAELPFPRPTDGHVVTISTVIDGVEHYMDGLASNGTVKLRNRWYRQDPSLRGTLWELSELAPSVYLLQSQSTASNKQWINGVTSAGRLDLRKYSPKNNPGQKWRFYRHKNGLFSLESLGGFDKKWLSFDNNKKLYLHESRPIPDYGPARNWSINVVENVVFRSGNNWKPTYRIPSLVRVNGGRLLAFSERRNFGISDTGDIDIVYKISDDGGISWGEEKVLCDMGADTCGNPTSVFDDFTNTVWIFMNHNIGSETQSAITNGSSRGIRTIWASYSLDGGETFSGPYNLTEYVSIPGNVNHNWWDAVGPGNGTQLVNGDLLIPSNRSIIISKDHGVSWRRISDRSLFGNSESQVAQVHLKGTHSFFRIARLGPPNRLVGRSSDGISWFGIRRHEDLIQPGCQGGLFSVSAPDIFSDGSIVLASGPKATDGRYNTTVSVSFDGGDTFSADDEILIYDGQSGYSSMTVVSQISTLVVGILFERERWGDDHNEEEFRGIEQISISWIRGL